MVITSERVIATQKVWLILIAGWHQCLANGKHILVMNMHQYNMLVSLSSILKLDYGPI